MGGFLYNCPLCCDRTFSSKQSLFEHLTSILENVYCPVCNNKWTSVVHLIEHLSLDNCQPDVPISQRILFDENSQENDISNSTEIQNTDTKVFQNENITQNNAEGDFSSIHTYEAQVDNTDVSKMYVELLDKQSCLQTQEIKLVKDGQSYMIMTQGDMDLSTGGTIVTKQNSDGTISLTTVDDMKIADKEEEITEEIYSCNTCKVSFSSVAEHIQTYHNDQDVVVEEPLDDDGCSVPVEFEPLESDNTQDQLTSGDKQHPRRVITDTGDIVEEPLSYKSAETVVQQKTIDKATNKAKDASKVKERVTTKRLLQKDKLCDSMVKVIKQEEKDGSYHKVIVKELQGQNGSKKLYHCLSCDFSAGNLNEFKNRACKALKYPCLHCPVAYDNSKSLCAHMKVHKAKPEDIEAVSQLYACEICTTIFPSNKSLKLHKRMHDPVKARPIEPPVVNVDGSEVSEGRFKCNVCDKLIPVDYRTIHQNSHITSDKMNCSICNKKFSSVEYLEMHMNVHNMDKVTINKQDQSLPYHCLYCERRFARPHEKVKHERIHTGEKPHSCEICGKSFRVSYCLTLHMRTHTGARPYGCPLCGKRFKAHSVYNHHLLTHSEVRAYKCPYCPKAFKTSVQLAGHKNSHTKPFSCQHCNRPFASLYAVRVHTETHARQNNLKFSCSLCGASYARAFALKDHVKQVHKQELEDLQNNQDEEWIGSEKVETEGIPDINEHDDLQNEMADMSASNELIVP